MNDIEVSAVWKEACELVWSLKKQGLSPAQTVLLLGSAIIAVSKMIEGKPDFRHSSVEKVIVGASEAIEANRWGKPS
jgi:hypothetical protein